MDRPLTGDALRYAAVSQRMLESGDWVHPVNGGRPYFAKPPLAFWLVATSLGAFGVSPEGAMLPSILAGIAVVVATFLLARRHGGDVAGWVAALALLFVPSFGRNTVTCRLESILLLASLGALVAFERARANPRWFAAAWALLGVAVMTKGAPGLAPLAVLAGAAVLTRAPYPFASRGFWTAAPVALLVAGPWYAHMAATHGAAFWRGAFETEVVDRLTRSGDRLRLVRDSLEYASYLVPPAVVGAFLAWRDGRADPALRRATAIGLSWIAVVVAGQVVNPSGFARYMYATLPALAGFCGYAAARLVGARARRPALLPAAVALAALVFLVLRVAGVHGLGHRRADAPHQRVLAAVDRLLPGDPVLAVVGEPTDAENFLAFHRRRPVRAVAPSDLASVLPAPGASDVLALVDDRALPAAREAGGIAVAEGNVYSVVTFRAAPPR